MKEQSVLSVLMFLIRYHMKSDGDYDLTDHELLPVLEKVGFTRPAILRALSWLSDLARLRHHLEQLPKPSSFRVFNDYECQCLNEQCRGYIMALEQEGILKPITREIVINQLLELKSEQIDIELIKWVTLIVLFNQPEGDEHSKKALSEMELAVLHSDYSDQVH